MNSIRFFVLCLMVNLSSAIRGERRRLQVLPDPTSKEVKCRPKDPVAKLPDKSGAPTPAPKALPPTDKTAAPTADLPYCADPLPKDPKGKGAKADCPALAKGELPKAFDNSVDGYLKVELTYAGTPAKVLAQVGEVLINETSAIVAGCPKAPKRRRLLNETLSNSSATNDTVITILGVNFTDIAIGGECTPLNKTLNCSEVTSNVAILYNGDANATEEAALLELLKTTIEAQAAQGSFDSAGEVGKVETGSSSTTRDSAEKSKSTNPAIIIGGAVAGVAALLGIAFAGYKYKKRSSRDGSFESEPVWTGVVAIAEAVQDSVGTTVKKVTGNAA